MQMKGKNIEIPQDSFVYFQLVFPKIIETIRLAAAPPEDQIAAFSVSEFPPEEVPFLVEHATLMSKNLNNKGFLSLEKLISVTHIDEKFNNFSKNDWTIEAMKNAESWKSVRRIALMALKTFNVSYATPNLYWIVDMTNC